MIDALLLPVTLRTVIAILGLAFGVGGVGRGWGCQKKLIDVFRLSVTVMIVIAVLGLAFLAVGVGRGADVRKPN